MGSPGITTTIGSVESMTGAALPRRRGRLRRSVLALVATLVGAAGVGSLSAADASAAGYVRACWSANGYALSGLTTTIQYYANDAWRYYGAPASTDGDGCVAYNIRGWLQRYAVRAYAAGVVPAWNATVDGVSYRWAGAGRRGAFLGTAGLRISPIPTDSFAVDTASWLDDMDNRTSNATCNTSSAALVACYMDRHNLEGNVIVPYTDSDGDGWFDGYDRVPNNPYYH